MQFSYLLAAFVGGEIIDLVMQSGAVAKMVLLVLLVFSLVSWALILSKWSLLKRARVQSGRFVRAFRKAQRMQDVGAVADQFRPSPLVGVFEGALDEYKRQMGTTGTLRNVTAVQRAMQIASSEEISRLERNLPWLATTGAVTPFVGLFGTVWGIIDAFHGLGTAGAATLRAVSLSACAFTPSIEISLAPFVVTRERLSSPAIRRRHRDSSRTTDAVRPRGTTGGSPGADRESTAPHRR